MNFDLMGEYYASSIGVVSLGLFYKRIRDFIYARAFTFDDPALADYAGYDAVQPVNGETADLFGVEVNLQQQLTFLPGFASGLGVYANYTYSWSEARLRGESDDPGDFRTVTLPGQTENVANLALSYEKYGFSGRLSMNYAGAFIDQIRSEEGEDRIYDERLQLDLSASQEVGRGLQVFVEALNLTNAPLRYYNGVTSRPEQQEFYSQWVNLGVKYDL